MPEMEHKVFSKVEAFSATNPKQFQGFVAGKAALFTQLLTSISV